MIREREMGVIATKLSESELLYFYATADPSRRRLIDVPQPSAWAGEFLVRVHAAGLNPVDFKTRAGALKIIRNYPLPIVMGNELAGGSSIQRIFLDVSGLFLCPRRESNPHLRFRKPPFYPLNYGDR
jgi:Alcohol dehydrogenase GroES-like domain